MQKGTESSNPRRPGKRASRGLQSAAVRGAALSARCVDPGQHRLSVFGFYSWKQLSQLCTVEKSNAELKALARCSPSPNAPGSGACMELAPRPLSTSLPGLCEPPYQELSTLSMRTKPCH
jgi:hypothetical protein